VNRRSLLPVFAMLLMLPVSSRAASSTPQDLVLIQSGTLPIILTAPHGGRQAIPGVPPRNVEGKPKSGAGYVVTVDSETDRLTLAIAAEIKALTGKDVYLVIARFHRRYIDANRPPAIAFDDPQASPYYDHYHQTIRRFVDEVRKNYRDGLLIDVHGQSGFPDNLVRGTTNGRSVARLIARAGDPAVTGPTGLFGQLEHNGFRMFPENTVPPSGRNEDGGYSGGYTNAHYGSHTAHGIDVVQFEFGSKYRQKDAFGQSARSAAKSIVAFHDTYLK